MRSQGNISKEKNKELGKEEDDLWCGCNWGLSKFCTELWSQMAFKVVLNQKKKKKKKNKLCFFLIIPIPHWP